MKIIVLSDTHSKKLPSQVLADIKSADLLVHSGDFCEMDDYQGLMKLKEIKAVWGNMDSFALKQLLPRKDIFECEGHRFGLFHGQGSPQYLMDVLKEEYKNEKVDAIIFGHSHHPLNEERNGVLYFNPGSPTDTIFAPYRSYGIIEVTPGSLKGKIIQLKD